MTSVKLINYSSSTADWNYLNLNAYEVHSFHRLRGDERQRQGRYGR